jgi:hypothetical protein
VVFPEVGGAVAYRDGAVLWPGKLQPARDVGTALVMRQQQKPTGPGRWGAEGEFARKTISVEFTKKSGTHVRTHNPLTWDAAGRDCEAYRSRSDAALAARLFFISRPLPRTLLFGINVPPQRK